MGDESAIQFRPWCAMCCKLQIPRLTYNTKVTRAENSALGSRPVSSTCTPSPSLCAFTHGYSLWRLPRGKHRTTNDDNPQFGPNSSAAFTRPDLQPCPHCSREFHPHSLKSHINTQLHFHLHFQDGYWTTVPISLNEALSRSELFSSICPSTAGASRYSFQSPRPGTLGYHTHQHVHSDRCPANTSGLNGGQAWQVLKRWSSGAGERRAVKKKKSPLRSLSLPTRVRIAFPTLNQPVIHAEMRGKKRCPIRWAIGFPRKIILAEVQCNVCLLDDLCGCCTAVTAGARGLGRV